VLKGGRDEINFFAFAVGSCRVVRGLKVALESFETGKTRGMEK
jgi:hypothetical protein